MPSFHLQTDTVGEVLALMAIRNKFACAFLFWGVLRGRAFQLILLY
jgi:hypothetical protein